MEKINGIERDNGYWLNNEYHCDCDICMGGKCVCNHKYFMSDEKVNIEKKVIKWNLKKAQQKFWCQNIRLNVSLVEDTGEIKVYYGAADTCICVATAEFETLIAITLNRKDA